MSFILDALKKSETDRQQQGSAEFSSVPTDSKKSNPARWLWMLAVLLGINFAVLIGILMRSESTPTETAAATTPDEAASFEEQIAEAIEDRKKPLTPPRPTPTDTAPTTTIQTTNVPTIDQLRLNGSLQLAELHLDIHVYSEDPAGRFVFINMVKHREQSRIAEGPVVNAITPDGVILSYQGRDFLLPRR